MTDVTSKKETISDKEYLNLLGDVRETVKKTLPDERNYVQMMCVFFKKYDDDKGRMKLRRVFNGHQRDIDVLRDFERLPSLIEKARELAEAELA